MFFQGLSNGTTLMQIQSGRAVQATIRPLLLIRTRLGCRSVCFLYIRLNATPSQNISGKMAKPYLKTCLQYNHLENAKII